jgi:hypothetical protein
MGAPTATVPDIEELELDELEPPLPQPLRVTTQALARSANKAAGLFMI